MKLFLVASDSMSKEQETAFLQYIKSNGFGWWHWLENFWIIATSNNSISSYTIRDALNDSVPGLNNLVIEVENVDSWGGYGPKGDDKNMFKWLQDNMKIK